MYPMVLKLDVSGLPVKWISWQDAAVAYARDRVKWEAGETSFELRGGTRAGEQTLLRVNSIIAVADRSRHFDETPRLTNLRLFARDRNLCLYCGVTFDTRMLTRDHVIPRSRGGHDTWENCVSSCRDCNSRKDDRTPDEASMPLLAVPYSPNHAESLILSSRNILADQMAFLQSFGSRRPTMSTHIKVGPRPTSKRRRAH